MNLGENIKNRRENLKLSQEYVAEQLGVSRQAVSKWETGQTEPTANNLIRLAEVFEINLSELVGSSESNKKPEHQEKTIRIISKKKLIVCLTTGIACIVLAGIIMSINYIRKLPVDWDAGACSGGYAAFIFDKYNQVLTQKYLDGLGDKDDILSVKAIKGTQEAEWEDQTIYLQFDLQYEHSTQGTVTETVRFIGQRTWFDTYDWSGAIVKG